MTSQNLSLQVPLQNNVYVEVLVAPFSEVEISVRNRVEVWGRPFPSAPRARWCHRSHRTWTGKVHPYRDLDENGHAEREGGRDFELAEGSEGSL